MTPEQVLAQPPQVLTQAQRESYFANGCLLVERLIPADLVARLSTVTADFIEQSKQETRCGTTFDLAPGHGPTRPMVRRLKRPDERHPLYWEYATGLIADVVADLVGPDVVFHHSKLNFKWHEGGDEVKWHQDIQFYPHTNYSPLTVGLYLRDTGMDDGPLMAVPGSHDGPLYDQYDAGATGPAACRMRTPRPSIWPRSPISPARPARSPSTTAARCTARRPPGAPTAGLCS